MKTIKSLSEAEMAEYPKLPTGWQWTRLGEIADNIQYGYTESSTDEPIGPKFLRITDIQNNEVIWKSVPYCKIDDAKKQNYMLKDGDLVFARTGATVGKSYLLKGNFPESIFASYLIRVRLLKEVSESFVYNFFRSLIYWKQITEGQVGIGQPNVNGSKLSLLIVPVAPLPEQRAIISKIELLFSELDNGIANLKLAQEQLKVYRQAVLKKAFEGELTKKWREQQTNLPDAGDLLEQIRKEREEATKVSGKKLKYIKPLTEAELPNLPKGWGWIRLGNLVEEPKYGTSKKCDYNVNGIGVLRIPNISDGLINDSDLKYAQFDPTEIENYRLKMGDILTIRSNGSVDLVGKCALVSTKDEKHLYAGYLIKLRPISSLINSKYLLNCLSSIDVRYQIESKAKSTSGVNNINSGELQSLIIPVCTPSEQQAIVQEIETRLSICDKVEQDIEENLIRAEALRQSILKKAFEGKLLNEKELAEVRRAEDWEPAEVLLKRIRIERVGK